MSEHELLTRDGRTLKVLERGDPAGRPVVVHHGMPNSRILSDADVASAQARGIRLISYDRPGYGGSTPHPGRSIASCADDVRDIAAALGIERLGTWGVSAGGPHALACAALLPDLVAGAAVLASGAPWGAEGLDYFAGMGELNAQDTLQVLQDPAAARRKCESDRVEILALSLEEVMEFMRTLLAPVDRAVFTGETGRHLLDSLRTGLAPGPEGWWEDEVSELAPWGFELSAIRVPVLLLHGRHDRFVPFAHGEWLAAHIPGVEAILSDADGHLTLTANHLDAVHDWLVDRLR